MPRRDVDIIIKARDDASRKFNKAGGSAKAFGKTLKSVGTSFLAVGAAAGAAFVAVDRLATIGDDIGKGAKKIGVTAEEFQKLAFAARRSGASAGNINAAFKRMSSTIFDAERGIKESSDALDELGLSVDDLKGKAPERQFSIIAERLNAIEDATTKAALAQDVFGRAGTELIPMIANYKSLAAEAEKVGLITNKNVEAAEKFKDQMEDLKTASISFVANSGLLEYITEVLEGWQALDDIGRGEITPFREAPTEAERRAQREGARRRRSAAEAQKFAGIVEEANVEANKRFFADLSAKDKAAADAIAAKIPDFDKEALSKEKARANAETEWVKSRDRMDKQITTEREAMRKFMGERDEARRQPVQATIARFRTSFGDSGTTKTIDDNLKANKTTADNTQKMVDAVDTLAAVLVTQGGGDSITLNTNGYQ
jgi:hypothetical protein